MKSLAAAVLIFFAGSIAREARASYLQNAQQDCAQANAHWVGGQQECACNAGYVQSNGTCVAAATGGSAAGVPSNAAAGGALGSAAATLLGGAVGGLFVTGSGAKPYVHVAPTPAVKGDDDLAPNPAIDSGVGDAQDIISGYRPPELSDGGAVSGADQVPILTGNIADIEDFLQGPSALKDFQSAARDMQEKVVSFGRGLATLTDKAVPAASKKQDTPPDAGAGAAPAQHAVGYDALSEAYRQAQGSDGTPQKLGFEYLPSQTHFFDSFDSGKSSGEPNNQ